MFYLGVYTTARGLVLNRTNRAVKCLLCSRSWSNPWGHSLTIGWTKDTHPVLDISAWSVHPSLQFFSIPQLCISLLPFLIYILNLFSLCRVCPPLLLPPSGAMDYKLFPFELPMLEDRHLPLITPSANSWNSSNSFSLSKQLASQAR